MLTTQPLLSYGADWHRVVSDRISSREQPLHNTRTNNRALPFEPQAFEIHATCPASPPHKARLSAICTAVSTVVSDLQRHLFPAVHEQFPPAWKGAEQALVLPLCPPLWTLQVWRAQVFVHSHAELRQVTLLPVLRGVTSPPGSLTHGNGYRASLQLRFQRSPALCGDEAVGGCT